MFYTLSSYKVEAKITKPSLFKIYGKTLYDRRPTGLWRSLGDTNRI
jgi:hypothetical protein